MNPTLGPMAAIADKALVDAFAAVHTAADQRAAAEHARTLAVKFWEAVEIDKKNRLATEARDLQAAEDAANIALSDIFTHDTP